MLLNWQQTLTKTLIWIVIEAYLDFVGLDSLADYSEFVFERHWHQLTTGALVTLRA